MSRYKYLTALRAVVFSKPYNMGEISYRNMQFNMFNVCWSVADSSGVGRQASKLGRCIVVSVKRNRLMIVMALWHIVVNELKVRNLHKNKTL